MIIKLQHAADETDSSNSYAFMIGVNNLFINFDEQE